MKKTILLFGLLWVFLYCLFGLYLGMRFSPIMQSLQAASMQGDLAQFWAVYHDWNEIQSIHTHGLGFGILTVLLAIIWDEIKLSSKGKNAIGIILISGIIINSVFSFIKVVPALVLGDILIIAAILLSLVGVFNKWKESK